MLGKLFNLGTGSAAGTPLLAQSSSQKPFSSLESVQEDIHTRNLLFPDAQALYQHRHDQVYPLSSGNALPATSSSNAFDYTSDIELEARDVRVIVMQDALSSVPASLLYDSQPPPPAPSPSTDRPSPVTPSTHTFTFQDTRRIPASARKSSLSQNQRPVIVQPGSPQLRQGAFDQRRPSVQSRTQPATPESDAQRALREYREELNGFSSCIFGNSELMAYKGTSTKVHVVPSETRPSDYAASAIGDGRGSLGRASMRSSRLSQSFTSENVFNAPPTPSSVPRAERKKVLITRLFPVNLPADDETVTTPHSRFSEDNGSYPFPIHGDDVKAKKRKPQPKQKRTPMYAIALVINLPPSYAQMSYANAPRTAFRGPASFTEQESSFPSSLQSRRGGWTMVGQGTGYGADVFESAISGDIEDRLDAITQHWDIIERTLTHLQSVVATTIFTMLKQVELSSPEPLPISSTGISGHVARTPSFSGRRGEDITTLKPPKTNAKHVSLLPYCLLDNRILGAEVDNSRTRIVSGLRATRVITGQNRWGIWREEARRVAKWANGKEHGSFFFNLLTVFLATHTDWLQALAPSSYRRRHLLQTRGKGEDEEALPARTIIVSHDKMAARRLIFLLSAFLPANQQLPSLRTHRPSTSASAGAFSQSPPSYVVPILKEESLRRKINRRTGPRRISHSRNVSLQGQRSTGVPGPLAHLSMEGRHERRSSDTASIRTTNLALPGGDMSARKSSATTPATVTPETSIPHFSTARRGEPFSPGRPGSSGSVAANDLKRLTREDSTGQYSHPSAGSSQSTKWGSVISGLWGARRRDSTNTTAHTRSLSGMSGMRDGEPSSPVKQSSRKTQQQPSKIVPDTQIVESPVSPTSGQPGVSATAPPSAAQGGDPVTPRQITEDVQRISIQPEIPLQAQRIPDPSGAFESPVKTSINLDDGVIDVDVPFPDYLTSFETAVSSPSSSGFLSTPGFGSGLDAFEQSSRASIDGDVPYNAAGWLQTYHADFGLQAIPAQNELVDQWKGKAVQEDLIEQVKTSLRAEATPASAYQGLGPDSGERWVDVSSAIIADTTNFTVTRIRYRRLIKPRSTMERMGGGTPVLSSSCNTHTSSLLLTPAISPYEVQLEDEFIEEQITQSDDVLVEAVERVISLSTDVSKGSSTCSSRSTSKRRERSNSESTQSDDPVPSSSTSAGGPAAAALAVPPQEVPRAQCKTAILSALEEVIQQVIEQREKGEGTAEERESVLRKAVRGWLEGLDLIE